MDRTKARSFAAAVLADRTVLRRYTKAQLCTISLRTRTLWEELYRERGCAATRQELIALLTAVTTELTSRVLASWPTPENDGGDGRAELDEMYAMQYGR